MTTTKTPDNDPYVPVKASYLAGLEHDSRFLSALERAGVDNWDGYDYAQELYDEMYPSELVR